MVMDTDNLEKVRLANSLPKKCQLVGLPQACRRLALVLAVFSLALVLLGPAWAADGALDPSFNPGAGVGRAPILWGPWNYSDDSGKSILAGSFTTLNGATRSSLARIKADGTLDDSFKFAFDAREIRSVILLNPASLDSKILIWGVFTIPSDTGNYYGLARLHGDGTVDDTFAHTFSRYTEGVSGAGVQTDGSIVVVGSAMPVTGYPDQTYYLLRLKADGTVDTTYPMRWAPGAYVHSVTVFPDSDPTYSGQARFTGTFPNFSDPTHVDYMMRLDRDGTTVKMHLGDEALNGPIFYVTGQGDGKVLICGAFTQVYGQPRNHVARLNPGMGSLDTSFNIGSGASNLVRRITVQPDKKIVLAGYFKSFNGTNCPHIVRLINDGVNDGAVDPSFNPGKTGADDNIWSMYQKYDGTWMINGAFRSYNGVSRQGIANLKSDGGLNPLYAGITTENSYPWTVYARSSHWDGKELIGGSFSSYGGKYHGGIVRVNPDGSPDESFIGRVGGVRSMSVQADGKIIVAGNFAEAGGYEARTSLARLNPDGSMDKSFKALVVKADNSPGDLAMVDWQEDGSIIVGGDFSSVNGFDRASLVRLTPDGSLDSTFNAQIVIPNGTDIQVYAGGRMGDKYAIGGYVLYQGTPAGFYTRLTSTGDLDYEFGPAGGPAPHINFFNGAVRCGTGMSDDRVVVGGDFTHVHDGSGFNIPQGHIARFTTAGLLDSTFAANPGANDPIYALERNEEPNDKIFIGGAFTVYNGSVRNRLARLNPNGSVDASFDPGTGANGPVYALNWNNYRRRVRIVGAFTSYQGVSRPGIAQIFASAGSFDPALLLLLNDSPTGSTK